MKIKRFCGVLLAILAFCGMERCMQSNEKVIYAEELKSFTIENGVLTGIPEKKKIIIPDHVKKIKDTGMNSVTTEIYIPSTVEKIETEAFVNLDSLKKINVDDDNVQYMSQDGVLYSKDKRELFCCPSSYEEREFILEDISVIKEGAFSGCSNLEYIYIPSSVEEIERGAFSYCENLENIIIPSSVKEIGMHAFLDTKWLEREQKKSPYVIVNDILVDISAVTGDVEIPEGVVSISDGAFAIGLLQGVSKAAESITKITIPIGVESIGRAAFVGCRNLVSVTIPNTVVNIEDDAFGSHITPKGISSPNENLIIYCEENSAAQEYAEKNDIKYEIKEEGKYESKQNKLEQKVLTLIKNTNGRENPLLEYSDPENLFCGYAMSLAAQSAVYVYGDEFSKSKLWVGGYERCLDALLAEDNLIKILSDCEISKFVEVVNNTKELIDMAITDKLSTMIKATDGVNLVNILKLSDSFVRAKLQYYDGCVAILCQIMDNTNNENLKEACRVVMNDRYTFVIEEIEKQMMECFVEDGIVLLEHSSEILGEFLAKYIALGAGEIATVIACSAEALSYVKTVVVAKDIISEITGLRKRVENYLDAICLNTIYFASANSYNDSLKKINGGYYEEKDISNIISMFEFVVKVKQKQYDCMNNMFTPDKLQKIKAADNYIGKHMKSLNKITIDNYSKVELQKLTPTVELKQSIKKGTKDNVRVTGIAYKGKITYKSTNKKVAKVNSSGKVTAKKVGNTKIIVKIKQYGEEIEIEKEVKVYK